MGTIAKLAMPSPPSQNPLEPRVEVASPSLVVALTIGEALTMEQEPPDPPVLRRSIQGPGKWDVAGRSFYLYVLLFLASGLILNSAY